MEDKSIQVNLCCTRLCACIEQEKYVIYSIYYQQYSTFSFLVPKEGYDLDSIIEDLDFNDLRCYTHAVQLTKESTIRFPEFSIKDTIDVVNYLQAAGVDELVTRKGVHQ